MVQPLVTEVETVVAAIVMAVKATEHHGKQNTKPTTFFQKLNLRSDPHLPPKKNRQIISFNRKLQTTNLSLSSSLSL